MRLRRPGARPGANLAPEEVGGGGGAVREQRVLMTERRGAPGNGGP